jgi:hypothetical protein
MDMLVEYIFPVVIRKHEAEAAANNDDEAAHRHIDDLMHGIIICVYTTLSTNKCTFSFWTSQTLLNLIEFPGKCSNIYDT